MSSESVDGPLNKTDIPSGAGVTRYKTRTISPSNDSVKKPANNKVKFRKQTQAIAAKAAQRRANLHHKELMEDMGKKYFQEKTKFHVVFFLLNLGSTFPHESIVSKENTASAFGLEITGVKPKKTVTINDPAASRSRANEFRRTNSDSPELIITGKIDLLSFRRINF
jgi:hypothetical protein